MSNFSQEEKLYSSEEIAKKLGVSKNLVRKLITTGELPAYRISERVVRIKGSDLEALLRAYRGGEAGQWKSKN